MRVWLHEWKGNEWGWNAWSLDQTGFATWAPTRDEVLLRVPGKFDEYQQWLARHGCSAVEAEAAPGDITVVEEVSGNEVLFKHDLVPATSDEIAECLRLLSYSRQDLVATIEGLPDSVLDWDPPYRQFAEWARWRTIRQIVEHIALTEVGYYLPAIGYSGPDPTSLVGGAGADWREQLLRSRRETERFLTQLAGSHDRARVTRGEEDWSVRKVLRRLVRHELLHWKSIRRIVRDYGDQEPPG